MKKTVYIFLLFLSVFAFGQSGPNPFAEPESQNTFSRTQGAKEGKEEQSQSKIDPVNGCCGNPADPAPIDDYLPLLVVVALGLIVYQVRKQKQLN